MEEEKLSPGELFEIHEALKQVKQGSVSSIEEVAGELGLVLNE